MTFTSFIQYMHKLIVSRFEVRVTHREGVSIRILKMLIFDVPGYL
jgi:hypothetical protein